MSVVIVGTMLLVSVGRADVVEFIDAQAWQSAVGSNYSTIDFTGYPADTFITDQYVSQGIVFTGVNLIAGPTPGFVNDSWGLIGPVGISFSFDAPQNWIGVDYPGGIKFQLFNQGELVYTSTFFQPGGLGNFAGLVSDVSFDEVHLFKPNSPNAIFIDDLHWGAIPVPGAMALLALGAIHVRSRRSR